MVMKLSQITIFGYFVHFEQKMQYFMANVDSMCSYNIYLQFIQPTIAFSIMNTLHMSTLYVYHVFLHVRIEVMRFIHTTWTLTVLISKMTLGALTIGIVNSPFFAKLAHQPVYCSGSWCFCSLIFLLIVLFDFLGTFWFNVASYNVFPLLISQFIP